VIRALRVTADRYRRPNNGYGYGIPDGLAVLRGVTGEAPPLAPRGLIGVAVDGPNPMLNNSLSVSIRVALAASAAGPTTVRLVVADAAGRVVARPWAGSLAPGETRSVEWRAGGDLSAGIHWVVAEAGGSRSAVRVVSLR
jgi:hypothetical protein